MELKLVTVFLLVCIAVVEARFLQKKIVQARSFGGGPTLRNLHGSLSVQDEQRGGETDDIWSDHIQLEKELQKCIDEADNKDGTLNMYKGEKCVCTNGLMQCDADYEMPSEAMMEKKYKEADLKEAYFCLEKSKIDADLVNIYDFVECVCYFDLHPCGNDDRDENEDDESEKCKQESRGKLPNDRRKIAINRGLQKVPVSRALAQRNTGKQRGFGGTDPSERSETVMDLLRELRQLKKSNQ